MTIHIIGAGLSGLSTAFHLLNKGEEVIVYDASPRAGGRCYSYEDKKLNALIDNGTHLMLGANKELLSLLKDCQTKTPLKAMGNTLTFYTKKKESFKISTNKPFSLLFHLKQIFPLLIESLLNTSVSKADKKMGLKTLMKCIGKNKGEFYLAYPSLKDSVITPIVKKLQKENVRFCFSKRLKAIENDSLVFFENEILPLKKKDRVVLALNLESLKKIVPTIDLPSFETIVGIHYKIDKPLPENVPVLGLVGFLAHWVFVKNGVLSVTISAANQLLKQHTPDELASRVWLELNDVLELSSGLPPYQVIAEKRATPLQTKHTNKTRVKTDCGFKNVFIAGDFTDTNLPCTMEGAVLSGKNAAKAVIQR